MKNAGGQSILQLVSLIFGWNNNVVCIILQHFAASQEAQPTTERLSLLSLFLMFK